MSEETQNKAGSDELVTCYVSKKLVPVSDTVEVQYGPGKKHRVLPKYVKY